MNRSSPLLLHLLLTLLLLLLLSSTSAKTPPNFTTVYEILSDFGLPIGLLPSTVKNFSLSEDGHFVVELDKPCYIQFDYLVYYDKTIKGILKYGSITDLKGIEVKKLFLWLDVDEIRVDLPPSDSIYFQVGWINKKLDVDQFQTVHSCKDNGLGCSSRAALNGFLKFPEPVRELPLLLTE